MTRGTLRTSAVTAAAIALTAALAAQTPATSSRTREYVTTLASDRTEGRLTGSPGEQLASDYIVSQLQRIGAKPLPGASSFLMPFEFTAGTKDGGSKADVIDARYGVPLLALILTMWFAQIGRAHV